MRRFPPKIKLVAGSLILIALAAIGYFVVQPLPPGSNVAGPIRRVPADSVTFLADRTYVDRDGTRHTDQQIFDEVFRLIDQAEHFILVDMFLFNSFQGDPPETTRPLANQLAAHVIAKKQQRPDIAITVITDPINTVYGGALSPHRQVLEQYGIPVIMTDLTKLPDSNPLHALLWRTLVRPFGNTTEAGLLPHPFQADERRVTLRSWLALFNFKANHRKLIIADEMQADGTTKLATLVTSANPHDGSSAHGNSAIKVTDQLWQDSVTSEQAVATFSSSAIPAPAVIPADEEGPVQVQLLTEAAIRDRLNELIDQADDGDTVDMAMFYLSERSIIKKLIAAAHRGVVIRLLLDANKDAFGRTKIGVPNRPVAHELRAKTDSKIQVRWCDTHGEQCHSKLVLLQVGAQHVIIGGSANLTRRNIGNYNLETNVLVAADEEIPAIAAARRYFNDVWHNTDEQHFSVDYAAYADERFWKTVLYRLQESTGLSSF